MLESCALVVREAHSAGACRVLFSDVQSAEFAGLVAGRGAGVLLFALAIGCGCGRRRDEVCFVGVCVLVGRILGESLSAASLYVVWSITSKGGVPKGMCALQICTKGITTCKLPRVRS